MKTSKLLLILSIFSLFVSTSFSQVGFTPSQVKTVWEPRVMPSAVNIDSTFNAVVFKSENPYYVVASDFTVSASTALVSVTGLTTGTLEAGVTYSFDSYLFLTGAGSGGFKVGTGGTATATSIVFNENFFNNAADTFLLSSKVTSQGSSVSTAAAALADIYEETHGTITVNAAGTLAITFAQASASSTSTVKAGSYFYIRKINR